MDERNFTICAMVLVVPSVLQVCPRLLYLAVKYFRVSTAAIIVSKVGQQMFPPPFRAQSFKKEILTYFWCHNYVAAVFKRSHVSIGVTSFVLSVT